LNSELPLIAEMREQMHSLLSRCNGLQHTHNETLDFIKQSNQLLVEKMSDIQSRMKVMEYILGLRISDGK
jgi:hypothetical protein